MPDVLARNLPFLAAGLATTLAMAALTALAGTVLALVIAVVRDRRIPVLAPLLAGYVGLIQGTPVLIVLLICYVAIPGAIGVRVSASAACTVGFALFLAAYCAEEMRAGLRAVPASLAEAAAALGLSRAQAFRLVVLPLAARVAVPALLGQYVRMLKYTSVASVIGVSDLTGSALLVNARVFQPVPILGAVALVYFVLCLSLSLSGRALQRRWGGDSGTVAR